ncbi:ATP-dependent DNA helicase chl1 [Desmophyllum pertusum]|uniref:ATP-dependent DNA helicase chl1 n=1 Tax=Desmophyllum pertusum TaxID=174260 RepID=A0A9X0CVY7_9CNID|nr:ATP-dependent DNA helicase chl1 [Desmophyllum pertusum]
MLGWLTWIVLVQGIYNALSGEPPVIRDFQAHDLTQPEDVPSESGFQLPCKASGTSPLEYIWQHNGRDIKYGDQYRLLKSGTLQGSFLNHTNNGKYQCFVKNDFGEDFSRKLKVLVSAAGDFHYESNKKAPVVLGKAIEIPCPDHEPSYGVTYRWGGYSPADGVFGPFTEDERIAVTLDGTLVIMNVTRQDVNKVNNMRGIMCQMTISTAEARYSHVVDFKSQGTEFTGIKAPVFYASPKRLEEAREGYQKKLYCLAVAKPSPYIIWRKDGEKIEDGDDAYSSAGSFDRLSVNTFLTVKASPEWNVELSQNTSTPRSETTLLMCLARGVPSPRYRWFRNGHEIDVSDSRVKLQNNVLKLTHVDDWHEAVFQCVAENDQGMEVTSIWVHVEDAPTNVDPSSQRGDGPDYLIWIILIAILGVLLIVAIVVIIFCYKRRKARRDEATDEAPRYNEVFDDFQIPNLDPSTAGVASYEALDPEQDLDDSGLYEKLDFRPLDNGPDYDNPGKPLPEYLELVSDTNVAPGNTASTAKIGGPGKEYYEPMESDMRGNAPDYDNPDTSLPEYLGLVNNTNVPPENTASAAKTGGPGKEYYEPMEMEASNVKNPVESISPSPKYYELTAGNLEPTKDTKGLSSSADYYQPMADKTGLTGQGEQPSAPPEYYIPMAETASVTHRRATHRPRVVTIQRMVYAQANCEG